MSQAPQQTTGPLVEDAPATSDFIPFNRATLVGTEFDHIGDALERGHLSGDGIYTERCSDMLETLTGARAALLVHSCTAALEMAVLLAGVGPGDEVVMPSFTFPSTANAVVLRGATSVFVDIDPSTMNMDPAAAAAAVTDATRAILPIHYAGVGADMAAIMDIAASRPNISVIEDAAQGLLSSNDGQPLGSIGQLGAISFHETKNVTCGEGGALLINDPELLERAEIVREKGTNRSQFLRGHVDKYTWVDAGSSYILSELNAAFLFGQLQAVTELTERRLQIWERYNEAFAAAESAGSVTRPVVPDGAVHNAHLYRLLLPTPAATDALLAELNRRGVNAVFHYVPLHSSPAGQRFGRTSGSLDATVDAAARLVRLPLWPDMTDGQVDQVIDTVLDLVG